MSERIRELSTQELLQVLPDRQVQLLDVRPIDAYNGWRLQGEARGGHIPGARTLPLKWAGYLDWIEIVRAKGIRPEQPLVVYGYEREEADRVARMLERSGHGHIAVYHDFLRDWAGDESLPLEYLPRHRHLVPARWLRRVVDGTAPAEHAGRRYVICHAHYQNPGDYELGHIPGALALDTNSLESPDTWNRRSPDEVRQTLLGLGIDSDTTAIVYGRHSFPDNRDPFPGSSAGELGAFRCAFIMLWAGVKDVRILNGGVHSWTDEGFELTTAEGHAHPVTEFGAEIPAHPELAVDLPEAKAILAADDSNLVCVRSWPEYIGEVSGYNYIEKKGRIPGAVFAECGTDAYHMENYRNLDHTCREYGEIEAAWSVAGITADKHNAFYCGTGWRGSEAFFNAWLLGWPRVSVYDGGWYEWSSDPGNPIETGIPGQSPDLDAHA